MSDKETPQEILEKLKALAEENAGILGTNEPNREGMIAEIIQEVDLTDESEVTRSEPLGEGQRIRIEGRSMVDDEEGDIVNLTGKVRGVSPVVIPGQGIVGYEYIVELDDTKLLPTDGGEDYPYSCITIAIEACTPEEDTEASE